MWKGSYPVHVQRDRWSSCVSAVVLSKVRKSSGDEKENVLSRSRAMFNVQMPLALHCWSYSVTVQQPLLGISKMTFSWFRFYFVFLRPWLVSHPAWNVSFFFFHKTLKRKYTHSEHFLKKTTPCLQNRQGICVKEVCFSPGGNLVYFVLCPWHVLKVTKVFSVFLLPELEELLPQIWLLNV